MTDSTPFYLQGNFAPVSEERTAEGLPVEGALPEALRGRYLRNGPNPRSGDPGHWFGGDGMVHGIRLEGGQALWYRNRWVKGKQGELVRPDGTVDHEVALANTNVIGHAGRTFALVETSFPTELTDELDTIGPCDFEGRLTTSFTAHPKPCPTTGELHFFGYQFVPPWLTYHVLDAEGRLVRSEEIAVPGPTMIHDFAITDGHAIFMDLPICFAPELIAEGRFPYRWNDDYGARLGILPRGAAGREVKWFEIEPCYVFHPMNAFEEGGRLVLDVARYASLWREGPESFDPATLHRFTIDPAADKVSETPLDDRPVEFPRVDERRVGLPNRYGYAVENVADVGQQATKLVKYDLQTGACETHDCGTGSPGEAVFVPETDGAGEDEGWVLTLVYEAGRDASDLVVLDARDFAAGPVATVRLPARVPFGFHGNWVPDAS